MSASHEKVYIKYNPYKLETMVKFNTSTEDGGEYPRDGFFHSDNLKGKRLQAWVEELPKRLNRANHADTYALYFHGTQTDWEDVNSIIGCDHIRAASPEDIVKQMKEIYKKSKTLNLSSLNGYKELIDDAFRKDFSIFVIAPVSAGKSMLLNALLKQKLLPSRKGATTSKIISLRNIDNARYGKFSATVFINDGSERKIEKLTCDEMEQLNNDSSIIKIEICGQIPFLNSNKIPITINDTPGTNSNENPHHMEITMQAIKADAKFQSLVIFVLNAVHIKEESEAFLLKEISEEMKIQGKLSRDRFIFVMNKLDEYDDEPERVKTEINNCRKYLKTFGIDSPRIYPLSAKIALVSRMGLEKATKKDLVNAETMIETKDLHLEIYNDPCMEEMLVDADKDKQAEIHSGIFNLEAVISEHVNKYAKPMRVSDIAEILQKCFDNSKKNAELENNIMEDKSKKDKIVECINQLNKKLTTGEKAKEFQCKIDKIITDAKIYIQKKIEECKKNSNIMIRKLCDSLKNNSLSLEEAEKISGEFAKSVSDVKEKLALEISKYFEEQVRQNAANFQIEYYKFIIELMPKDTDGNLPFNPEIILDAEIQKSERKHISLDAYTKDEPAWRTVPKKRKIPNPRTRGFLGFFRCIIFDEPTEITKYVNTKEQYAKKVVNWKDFATDKLCETRAELKQICEVVKKESEIRLNDLNLHFRNDFKRFNNVIRETREEWRAMCRNEKGLEEKIKKNQKYIESIKQLEKELNNILEI